VRKDWTSEGGVGRLRVAIGTSPDASCEERRKEEGSRKEGQAEDKGRLVYRVLIPAELILPALDNHRIIDGVDDIDAPRRAPRGPA
jgi:hypothetical protein